MTEENTPFTSTYRSRYIQWARESAQEAQRRMEQQAQEDISRWIEIAAELDRQGVNFEQFPEPFVPHWTTESPQPVPIPPTVVPDVQPNPTPVTIQIVRPNPRKEE